MDESELELSTAYTSGLLDGLGWIRFDFSEGLSGDEYHVRPELRLLTRENPYMEGLLLEVLTGLGLDENDIRLAERSQTRGYVAVSRTGAFRTLRDALGGESALLIERVAFVAETLESHVRRALSPEEAIAYLQATGEIRHGWTPRGRRLSDIRPETIAAEHGIDDRTVDPVEVPTPAMRTEPSAEYIGGVTDAMVRLSLSMAERPGSPVGYSIYPRLGFRRAGVHPQFTRQVGTYLDEVVGDYESDESVTDLRMAVNGVADVRSFTDSVLEATYATYEWLAYLREEILPLFERDAHRTKRGFYEIVRRFEPLYREQGDDHERKYTPGYFEEEWGDELDLAEDG